MSPITTAVKLRLRAIQASGVTEDRVVGRMGQIGDSITHSSAFFRGTLLRGPLDNETGHEYSAIRSWLAYSGDSPANPGSFYADHGKGVLYGNFSGWTVWDAVAEGHPFVAIEVGDGVTAGNFWWALVMFGTNDIDELGWHPDDWIDDYSAFVEELIDLGVIPVLSTMPPQQAAVADGRVQVANGHIRSLARSLQVPLVDYYKLLLYYQPTDWSGTLISLDGIHPSAGGGGRDFSLDGLTTTDGYAARTKLALDMAEKLKAIVFEDGEPEPASLFMDAFESGNTGVWSLATP